MLDPLFSLAHSMQSNKGVFAVLLGSGVSRSSGIPTGWEVTLDLARRLAKLHGADPADDVEGWYQAQFGKAPDYSDLLDALAKSPAERRSLLHGYFEPTEVEREEGLKLPSTAHRAIATLAARGYIRVILTTNFDKLTEAALRDEGVEPVVISSPDAAEGAAPLVHQRCVVVKLHGDYLDDRIKNTEAELGAYDPRMDAYLDRVLDEFGLIVCGWSGEWDPALRAAIESCKSRRYTTYWAVNRPPGARAAALISLRQAQVLDIKDADSFFAALEDKVASLEELNAPAPMTAEAAVASLKRYVVEPRHRIRLHDLVMDEVARVRHHLSNQLPATWQTGQPADEFLCRMRQCEAATAILRALVFHGARWAEPQHIELFTHALEMVVPTGNENSFNTVCVGVMRYPAALMLYAAGLGAVASGNYRLLRGLLDVKFRHYHNDVIAGRDLVAIKVLDHGLAQSVLYQPQKRYTPVSENLADLLTPLVAAVVADPQALFDRLEVLIAMNGLHLRGDLSGHNWMPPGRYCWKAYGEPVSPASAVIAEAHQMGEEWPPLKAGMFYGNVQRLAQVIAAFNDVYGRMANQYF